MLSRALPAAVLAAACALPAYASVACTTFGQSHYMLPHLCDELNKDVDAIRNAASPERRAQAERRFRDNLEKFKELSALEAGSAATVHQKAGDFEQAAQAAREQPLRAPAPSKPESQRQEPDRSAREQRAAAEAQLNAGNPAGAVAALDRLIASGQADAETLGLRARAKAAQGDGQGALADARAALARNPEDPQLKALVSGLEGSAAAAEKLKRTNFDLGAQRAPEQAPGAGTVRLAGPRTPVPPRPGAPATADPPAADVAAPQVRVLLQRAQKLIDIGDLTGGLLHLREAIDLEPGRGELWDLLAELSNKLGNHEGAVAAAERALALDANDARALRARSYAYYQLGRYREALADADRAIALEPGNGLGHLYRAMALEKLGDAAGALQSYRNAVRLDPTLAPLADAAIKRLSGASAPAALSRGKLFRLGAVALSTLLIVAGLMGTAAGRRVTQGARRLLTPLPPPRDHDAPRSIAVGSVVGGHYRVTRELGRGGMGVVYQAHDETLQRPVAIKQLQSPIRSDPQELERFLREARLVAQLKHPNLAQIYSVVEGGDLLLVFEYVEGQPLDRLLHDASPLPPARALSLIGQICAALQYAHERRIVHRDLKPANVMLDPSGLAKVMDFGIAHQSRGLATLTMTAVSGTPPYMSPEQSLGSVSPSSDLYSLAVMSYEMLSGRRPFDGPDLHGSKLRKDFLPLSTLNPALPRALDAFFSRALDPDPAKRPADASAFAFELGRALDATPSRA